MFLLECYDVGGDSESSSAFPAKDGFSRGALIKALRKLFRFVILVINWNFQIIKQSDLVEGGIICRKCLLFRC